MQSCGLNHSFGCHSVLWLQVAKGMTSHTTFGEWQIISNNHNKQSNGAMINTLLEQKILMDYAACALQLKSHFCLILPFSESCGITAIKTVFSLMLLGLGFFFYNSSFEVEHRYRANIIW